MYERPRQEVCEDECADDANDGCSPGVFPYSGKTSLGAVRAVTLVVAALVVGGVGRAGASWISEVARCHSSAEGLCVVEVVRIGLLES